MLSLEKGRTIYGIWNRNRTFFRNYDQVRDSGMKLGIKNQTMLGSALGICIAWVHEI